MKPKRIVYSRLISKGNYENAKIEIELEIEDGETASQVFAAAKKWVNHCIDIENLSPHTIKLAQNVMADKRNHTLAQIEEAEAVLARYNQELSELPF